MITEEQTRLLCEAALQMDRIEGALADLEVAAKAARKQIKAGRVPSQTGRARPP